MTIVKRPPKIQEKNAAAFISGAPDATVKVADPQAANRLMLGNQAQISLAMPLELLSRVDVAAKKLSLTRAGFVKLALSRAVEAEEV